VSALLALASSALWGTGDYLGGVLSRRLRAIDVVLISQFVALLVVTPVAVATGGFGAPSGYVLPAAIAGLVGVYSLAAFYHALALGRIGVVAPVSALGVAVPVVVGLAVGERPSTGQLAGIALGSVGVVLAAGPEIHGAAPTNRRRAAVPILLALAAAVGFGTALVLIGEASRSSVVMTLLVQRAAGVGGLIGLALVRRRAPRADRRDVPLVCLVGLLDLAANAAYAVATVSGLISVVGVLGSLYPVVTVLLAWVLQGERLAPVQLVGAVATVGGVLLLVGA